MTFAEIQQIVRELPTTSPLWQRGGFSKPAHSMEDRLEIAGYDLKFGWKLAFSYHTANELLPAFFDQPSICRCYYNLGGISDPAMSEARLLDQPQTEQGPLLRALLFARDLNYESIAAYTKRNEEVIKLYSDLFFSVHDRLDDLDFISHHLYPETRGIRPGLESLPKESPEWQMRRSAYERGWRAAIQCAGADPVEAGKYLDPQQRRHNFDNAGCSGKRPSVGKISPLVQVRLVSSRNKDLGTLPRQNDADVA